MVLSDHLHVERIHACIQLLQYLPVCFNAWSDDERVAAAMGEGLLQESDAP